MFLFREHKRTLSLFASWLKTCVVIVELSAFRRPKWTCAGPALCAGALLAKAKRRPARRCGSNEQLDLFGIQM